MLDLDQVAPVVSDRIRLLPTVHDRLEMACVVRLVLAQLSPAGIAVELPTTLRTAVLDAVGRLPRVSVVIAEEPDEDATIWVCAPGDPFAEGMRWAVERSLPVWLIDPDLGPERPAREPIPDPYAIWDLGPQTFLSALVQNLTPSLPGSTGYRREAGMAHHLHQAVEEVAEGEILALVGAGHFRRIEALLGEPSAIPFSRVRRTSVLLRHLHPQSLAGLLPDPPLAHAAYELLRGEETFPEISAAETWTPKVSLRRQGLQVISRDDNQQPALNEARARYAARHSARPLLGLDFPDRRKLRSSVWRIAAGSYREQTQEQVQVWQRRLFFDYGKRLERTQGLLTGGIYEWTIAARGVADDNLAWEVFDAARSFQWQSEQAEIPTVRLDGDQLDLGTRKIRFRKRSFRVKRRPVPLQERPQDESAEDWLQAFDNPNICSHRPEDIVIEDFIRFLRQKAANVISSEHQRSEPFSTSLLDGIDIRETLRNVQDHRIYVRELARVPAGAGSVVIIFDRDLSGAEFPYCMTWLGEDEQESDMAFYSTNPAEQVVGPGITRATYGGLMMSFPPRRLYNVWQDPDYRQAREKAEVLTMSAVDYSIEKTVVHLAAHPPSESIHRYASRAGKRLLHLPIGSISPQTVKKIRVVHLLAGYDKRDVAARYIW